MSPNEHATAVMLPHLSKLVNTDKDYAKQAIADYFELCPWAKPLVGEQLRQVWRDKQKEPA